jgi:mannose-1-phosphate guanylyltransferase
MKFQNTIIPVILSGGHGTRLWPLSRKQYPKQYLPLVADNILLSNFFVFYFKNFVTTFNCA